MTAAVAIDPGREAAWVWGLPLAPLTFDRAVAEVGRLIDVGEPSYVVTANLNYAMLTDRHADLRAINAAAALVLADGMPLVWASRRLGTPVPERVAGADLIFGLADLAARRGYGVFLLGGAPGVAEAAARNLEARAPGLRVVGAHAPPFGELSDAETAELVARVRAARPDLLLVALGQPKGERWIARHHRALGVPVSIQVGAALDFAAGRARRAPIWLQRAGLEWAYRLAREPARLGGRYAANVLFLARMALADALGRRAHPARTP
jgi:N-acetylglucosaminyldiphosphoundecaprenol N-acetyl-beta-D-mannosaminyltransferase